MLTQSELKKLLHYDQETGVFTWLVKRPGSRGIKPGTVAGGHHNKGYSWIRIFGTRYMSHHLAWLYIYGVFPIQLDHKNCLRSDNRINNLREASHAENSLNRSIRNDNTSGFKGVSWDGESGKWKAHAGLCGKQKTLGRFDTPEAANEAYQSFITKHHGEFKYKGIAA